MPSEIAELVECLKSDDAAEREAARADLVELGSEAVNPLLFGISKGVPTVEVVETLKAMSPNNAAAGLSLLKRMGAGGPVKPEVIQMAQEALASLGVESHTEQEPQQEECKAIEVPIAAHWSQCKLSLEHPGSPDFPCPWLTAIVHFSTHEDKSEQFRISPTSEEAVNDFVRRLKGEGFSKSDTSTMREWEYITFTRG